MKHVIFSRLGAILACLLLLAGAMSWAPFAHAASASSSEATEKSDLNGDQVVDLADLVIFSSKYLELNWETVDWCAFYQAVATEEVFAGRDTDFYRSHFRLLLGFIYDEFNCAGGPLLLVIQNDPRSLTRLAADVADSGNFYISDARVGSVFIYDPNRVLIAELKNLSKPLGVAIDSQGYLLVGSDGQDNIEVYDPANGDLLATFGDGLVQMPTSITVGPGGEIYVTDSAAHRVWVFESSYLHIRTIGEPGRSAGQLRFPADVAIVSRFTGSTLVDEVYVADQGNKRIQVFDLHGNFVRSISPPTVLSSFCLSSGSGCPNDARGTFNRLQALDVDSSGRLHVLDMFEAAVSILDPLTGGLLSSYGAYGEGAGQLRTPLDVLLAPAGEALVTDNDSDEVEVFTLP